LPDTPWELARHRHSQRRADTLALNHTIENAVTKIVPAPGALILDVIGMAAVTLVRRRFAWAPA